MDGECGDDDDGDRLMEDAAAAAMMMMKWYVLFPGLVGVWTWILDTDLPTKFNDNPYKY